MGGLGRLGAVGLSAVGHYRRFTRLFVAGAVAALALTACAGGSGMDNEAEVSQQFAKTEEMLAKAGFQPVYAKNPATYADLKKLPQHSVIFHSYKENYRYLYVDTDLCGCVYVGNRPAYQRYQDFLMEQKVAVLPYNALDVSETIPSGLNQWGPFYSSAE
jgi:hypothetical protein